MNYFQKRELEWQKQQIKDDKRRMAEIKAMMVELQDAIQEEIERNWYVFSSGQGISMEEAYKRSNELDVVRFAKKAKKYVKNRDFSPQANKELKLYNLTMRVNRLELLKANIGLELIRTFDEIDKYVSNELTTVAKEEIKRQAGILYIDVSKNEYTSMLKQIANGSFQGVEFSNLIWSYQNELKADLSKLLQRSIVLGRNPKMLAPELKKYLTEEGKLNAKFNTQRLMVSETTNIQIAIQKQSYLDAGIEKYGYNAEPSACSVCAKLKDKTFLVSEMMPGKNAPSMHPFCRCSTYPVFEIEHAVDESKSGKTGNNGKNEKVDKADKDELDKSNARDSFLKNPFLNIKKNGIIEEEVDAWTPCLVEIKTGKVVQTEVKPISIKKKDIKGWKFDFYEDQKNKFKVQALYVKGSNRIEALISYKDSPNDIAIYVNHIERRPGIKEYEGVTAHMFASAVKESFELGYDGVVFFDTKNQKLNEHYAKTLNAQMISPYRMVIFEKGAKLLYEKYYGKR